MSLHGVDVAFDDTNEELVSREEMQVFVDKYRFKIRKQLPDGDGEKLSDMLVGAFGDREYSDDAFDILHKYFPRAMRYLEGV